MYIQPFAKRSSSEVRLHVPAPGSSAEEEEGYPLKTYDRAAHEVFAHFPPHV
jgi:hypothetical protein